MIKVLDQACLTGRPETLVSRATRNPRLETQEGGLLFAFSDWLFDPYRQKHYLEIIALGVMTQARGAGAFAARWGGWVETRLIASLQSGSRLYNRDRVSTKLPSALAKWLKQVSIPITNVDRMIWKPRRP